MVIRRKKRTGAELLTEYLEENNLSLQQFAEKINCSKSMVGHLKNGVEPPGLELACKIEKATRGRIRPKSWLPA